MPGSTGCGGEIRWSAGRVAAAFGGGNRHVNRYRVGHRDHGPEREARRRFERQMLLVAVEASVGLDRHLENPREILCRKLDDGRVGADESVDESQWPAAR